MTAPELHPDTHPMATIDKQAGNASLVVVDNWWPWEVHLGQYVQTVICASSHESPNRPDALF
jgi:hypothetical protein